MRCALLVSLLPSLWACSAERGTIGAMLAQRADRTLLVREVPPELAAARAGIRAGDEVLLIDGRDVRAMSPAEVHRALSGEVGAPVKLTLIRDDDVVRVTLRRTPARPELKPAPLAKRR